MVELSIVVTPAEYQKELEAAAVRLSARANIQGFRPGKVPLDVLKREVGEMAILQEALEPIVQKSFYEAVTTEKANTIGMPKIDVEKLAPGNDIVYKATVATLPKVVLPTLDKIKVERVVKPTEDKQLEETMTALRGLQANETVKDGEATKADKVVVDMNMMLDKVPVEGGQAKDYQVYLGEEHYIPGFNEKLIGAKKGEEKSFSLIFPENHYQKMLAGKAVDFVVNIKEVFERNLPELNDEFAKKLGQNSVDDLRKLVKENMDKEAEQKADQRWEVAVIDSILENSKIEEVPEVLIDAERQKMFYELKRDLDRNGVSIDQYLADIKKNEEDLFKDFRAQAEKRAKAALVFRQIALEEYLAPTEQEIRGEVEHMKKIYKDNKEYIEKLDRPEVRDPIATMIQNRKVMRWLQAKLLGKTLVEDPNLKDTCPDDDHEHHDHKH